MISVELARRLQQAGMTWTPARGDRFIVVDRGMDEEVFVLSDMTIELQHYPGGPVFGFNGTTEWALDSLEQGDTLWLPAEHQLRDRLGDAFERLERLEEGYRVHTRRAGPHEAAEPADAYALALIEQLAALSPAGEPRSTG